jgi:hypothetical protein
MVIFGIASYIPNAVLANHYYPIYHLMAVPFIFAPTLLATYCLEGFINKKIIYYAITISLMVCISLLSIRDFQKEYWWNIFQDETEINLINGLSDINTQVGSGKNIGVIGVARDQYTIPFLPWENRKAIDNITGSHNKWVIFNNTIRNEDDIEFRMATSFPGDSDMVIFISEMGKIVRIWRADELSRYREVFPHSRLGNFLYSDLVRSEIEKIFSASVQSRNVIINNAVKNCTGYHFLTISSDSLLMDLRSAKTN